MWTSRKIIGINIWCWILLGICYERISPSLDWLTYIYDLNIYSKFIDRNAVGVSCSNQSNTSRRFNPIGMLIIPTDSRNNSLLNPHNVMRFHFRIALLCITKKNNVTTSRDISYQMGYLTQMHFIDLKNIISLLFGYKLCANSFLAKKNGSVQIVYSSYLLKQCM